jgi:Protein of unknown function (DUF3617)
MPIALFQCTVAHGKKFGIVPLPSRPSMKNRLRSSIAASLGLLCGGAALAAADYPPRKPGLWELSMQTEAMPAGTKGAAAHTTQQCIDAASDKAMREMGMSMGRSSCSKQDLHAEGSTMVVDSVCTMPTGAGTTTATTHSVITGDMSSDYRMVMKSSYNPPMMGRATGEMVMAAKWIGPCKPGQKPGDMVMPGGQTMNMLDMMKNQSAAQPPKK